MPSADCTPENQRLLKSEVGARAIMDLSRWYEEQWQHAIDYKEQLIELLENSKFGGREYTPYEIYMKALYEYCKDDLDSDFVQLSTRSAVDLAEFQEDAVRKARRILAQYDGVIVADSVGLGKTWIGKKLLQDYAYHLRQKALVICPASLKPMWENELRSASISSYVVTQERLAVDDFDIREVTDMDVILVDEAHNFRNRRGMFFYFTAQRDSGRAHFWRYYDLETRRIIDNRYHIMQIIACSPDTPRFPPPYQAVDVFAIQDKIIENILGDVAQND